MGFRPKYGIAAIVVLLPFSVALACGGQSTAGTCEVADDCYQGIDVEGDPVCFDQVEDGYCSHTCESNADCCAADGECDDNYDYVCTGLESRSGKYCFVSCSEDSGSGGDQSICDGVSRDLECRNTGRGVGSQVCLPSSSN